MKKILSVALSLALVLSLAACGDIGGDVPEGSSGTPEAVEPDEPAVDNASESDVETPEEQSPEFAEDEGPQVYRWVIEIGSINEFTMGNQNVTMQLELMCYKDGGDDMQGEYKGTMKLIYNFSMSDGTIRGEATGQGEDNRVKFYLSDMPSLDIFDAESPDMQIGTDFDFAASGTFDIVGSGEVEERAAGVTWNDEGSGVQGHPYAILVFGDIVALFVPTLSPIPFHGIIYYVPMNVYE